MRVIGGALKGHRLKVPPVRSVRPTSERVRQVLFDILSKKVIGASFLDICAGTGSVGIEALSRGAAKVVFIEKDMRCAAVLEANLEAMCLGGQALVLRRDALLALQALTRQGEAFDILFADPPYESSLGQKILKRLGARNELTKQDSLVVIQHFAKEVLPEQEGFLERTRVRRLGETALSFYKRRL